MEIKQSDMERRSFQRCPVVNPNPGLWEYKVKTGRSSPNTNEEWEVYEKFASVKGECEI